MKDEMIQYQDDKSSSALDKMKKAESYKAPNPPQSVDGAKDIPTVSTQPQEDLSQNQEQHTKKTKIIEIITKSSIFGYFLNAMIIFGVCFVCCWFVFYVLFTQVEVVGLSMLPTINSSAYDNKDTEHIDYVFILKSNHYERKDIVVIKEGKTTSNSRIIKRIIAVPGDTIGFKKTGFSPSNNNKISYDVYLNGKKLEENYIFEQKLYLFPSDGMGYDFYNLLIDDLDTSDGDGDGFFEITMDKNQYFVMGDNRNNSTDSRYFGPVTKDEIIGKSVIHVKYGQTLFETIWKSIFSQNLLIYTRR